MCSWTAFSAKTAVSLRMRWVEREMEEVTGTLFVKEPSSKLPDNS